MKSIFTLLAANLVFVSFSYSQVKVNSSGYVGIGNVANPESVLEIKGSQDTSYFYKGTNEDVIIKPGKPAGDVTIVCVSCKSK